MLSTKDIAQIRNLFTAIINNVSGVYMTPGTLHLLGENILATLNTIKAEHGDSECHACKVLFYTILKSAPQKTQEIFESLR